MTTDQIKQLEKDAFASIELLDVDKRLATLGREATPDELFKIEKATKYIKDEWVLLLDGDDLFKPNKIFSLDKLKLKLGLTPLALYRSRGIKIANDTLFIFWQTSR